MQMANENMVESEWPDLETKELMLGSFSTVYQILSAID